MHKLLYSNAILGRASSADCKKGRDANGDGVLLLRLSSFLALLLLLFYLERARDRSRNFANELRMII